MRHTGRLWIVVPLLLAGCVAAPNDGGVADKQRYLAAKALCESRYPRAMVQQSDCRADAANAYIRPWYRYGDLMTWVQTRRRELAVRLDNGQISRAEFDRQVARAEREVEREENRRNRASSVPPA